MDRNRGSRRLSNGAGAHDSPPHVGRGGGAPEDEGLLRKAHPHLQPGRAAEAEEISACIQFLLSPAASNALSNTTPTTSASSTLAITALEPPILYSVSLSLRRSRSDNSNNNNEATTPVNGEDDEDQLLHGSFSSGKGYGEVKRPAGARDEPPGERP